MPCDGSHSRYENYANERAGGCERHSRRMELERGESASDEECILSLGSLKACTLPSFAYSRDRLRRMQGLHEG